jgi:hypothetical protein
MSTAVAGDVIGDVEYDPFVKSLLSIAVIVLCGCAVLAPHLEYRCVSVDEYATYLLVTTRGWRQITEWVQTWDTNPPTHYLLLRFWSVIFGDSLVTLRAMNILPTILSGLGVWWYLRRKEVGWGWATAAGCSVVASPTLLYYSRIARYYSWPACFGSLAVLSYAEWRRTKKTDRLVLAGSLELLCGYFHYLAWATLFFGVTIAMLVEWRRGRLETGAGRRFILMRCAVIGLMTPLVLWNVYGILAHQVQAGVHLGAVRVLSSSVLALLYIPYGVWFSENFFPWDWWFTIPAALLWVAVMRLRSKLAGSVKSQVWFTTAATGSVLAALVMTILFRLEFRHAVVAVLWVSPLVSVWIWETLSLASWGMKRSVVAMGIVIMQALGIHAYYSYRESMYPDVNWRQVAAVLENRVTRDDLVVVPGVSNTLITGSLFDPYWAGETISVVEDTLTGSIESPGLTSFRWRLKHFKGNSVWLIERTATPGEALEVRRLLNAQGLTPRTQTYLFPRDVLARAAINSLTDKSVSYRLAVWRFAAQAR